MSNTNTHAGGHQGRSPSVSTLYIPPHQSRCNNHRERSRKVAVDNKSRWALLSLAKYTSMAGVETSPLADRLLRSQIKVSASNINITASSACSQTNMVHDPGIANPCHAIHYDDASSSCLSRWVEFSAAQKSSPCLDIFSISIEQVSRCVFLLCKLSWFAC